MSFQKVGYNVVFLWETIETDVGRDVEFSTCLYHAFEDTKFRFT